MDFTKIRPVFVTELVNPGRGGVSQCVVKHPVTGDLYMDQATKDAQERESVCLNRFSSAGVLQDFMILTLAGHGTVFDLEIENGVTYVWISWKADKNDVQRNSLVRFPYTPGVTWDLDNPKIEVMNKFGGYVSVMFDWKNGLLCMRDSYGDKDRYRLRNISDVKANVDRVLREINLTMHPPTMQGYATSDFFFYRLTGTSDGKDPRLITRYSWYGTEAPVSVSVEQVGKDPSGRTPNNFREPEGISVYCDPITGELTLLVVMVVGYPQHRRYYVWGFTESSHDLGRNVEALGETAPVTKDQKARRPLHSTTKLSELSQPGWYQLTGTEMRRMTDRPGHVDMTRQFLLDVSGRTDKGMQAQQLMDGEHYWMRMLGPGLGGIWYRFGGVAD